MTLPKLLAVMLPLSAGLMVGAEEQTPVKPQDPQAAYEPRTEPGAGQKFLEGFVGDWEVVKTFHPRAGDPVQAKGGCHQAMMHNGRFLKSEFVFGDGENKITGLGIIGYNVAAGTFTSVWTDSRSTEMSLRSSQDKFNGKEIVLYSRSIASDGKETRHSRTVTRMEDDGRKIVHRQYALSPDGEERLMMELVLTRKTP